MKTGEIRNIKLTFLPLFKVRAQIFQDITGTFVDQQNIQRFAVLHKYLDTLVFYTELGRFSILKFTYPCLKA